jgi:N-acetylglucosaminyldiphosphoundecaprenol N-acetyl-beta-D-mannosaminyltransferase
MRTDLNTFEVLGIPVAITDLDAAAARILDWKSDRRGRAVGVRDVASLMAMLQEPKLMQVARRTAMNVPDGMPLVWIGRRRGQPVRRVCGPDLMEKVLMDSPASGLKHFFYGGKEGVAGQLAEVFRNRAPGIQIVGTYCPPFRPLTRQEDAEVVAKIRASGADVVWVGVSSPKQDIWMDEHLAELDVTMIGVGAAFDFHSGAVKRAPKWMQNAGLEWAHRLASEPRRLWRRYLILVPKFVLAVCAEEVGRLVRRSA